MCLSSPYTSKVPNSQETQILYKAGLGMKKIKLFSDDAKQDMYNKLTSEDSENGGFPKLKGCGGFDCYNALQTVGSRSSEMCYIS